jgi:hypothetical protein
MNAMPGHRHGRLWSLLDMLRHHAEVYVEALNILATVYNINQGSPALMNDNTLAIAASKVERLVNELSKAGLRIARKRANLLLHVLRSPNWDQREVYLKLINETSMLCESG